MTAKLSIDQQRAIEHARSVGAWPSNRQSNVLAVPQPRSQAIVPQTRGRMTAPAPQPQAPRSVGQDMPPMPTGCCVFPGSMKYIAESIALATGVSGTVSLDSPGMFCPQKLFIFATVDLADVLITKIQAGIRNQILSGEIVATAFSIANTCCPIACIECMCMPGVSLDVTVQNNDAMTQTVTVVAIGCYVDACPPGGMATSMPVPPPVPGCPMPGSDKLVGFDSGSINVAASATVTFTVETPGRFCPRQMLLFASSSFTGVFVDVIQSGIENQIIEGSLPAELWSIDNDCCILSCFKCLCMPGVPLIIKVRNGSTPQRIRGMLVGTYQDAC